MPPAFTFMTGATKYRIEAQSQQEAIQYIFDTLQPTEDMKAVILSTLCDEEAAQKYADKGSGELP
jgi:hypothetical protein